MSTRNILRANSLLELHDRSPRLRRFLEKEAGCGSFTLNGSELARRGILGPKKIQGAVQIFRHAEDTTQITQILLWRVMVSRPVARAKGREHRIDRSQARNGSRVRENIEPHSSVYTCTGKARSRTGRPARSRAASNSWHRYAVWPPKEAQATNIFACGWHAVVCRRRARTKGEDVSEYVSDPQIRAYRQRPIFADLSRRGLADVGVADQRFWDHRPDVLSFVKCAARSRHHFSGQWQPCFSLPLPEQTAIL